MLGYDWPRLHAALNDLPAALLLAAVIFDFTGAAFRRPTLLTAGYWTLMFGAVGAILAVVSGLQAEEHIAHGSEVHELMETHEKLALFTLGVFALLALWRLVRERRMGGAERTVSRVAALAGVILLLVTASYGGRLVFDHAAGISTQVLEEEVHERAAGHHHGAGDHADDHAAAPTDSGAPTTTGTTGTTAADAPSAGGHTHAPGTPPHED